MNLRALWRALVTTRPMSPQPAPAGQLDALRTPPARSPRRWSVIALLVPLLALAFVAGRAAASDATPPPAGDGGSDEPGDDACVAPDLEWPPALERLPGEEWPPGLDRLPAPGDHRRRSELGLPRFGWLPDGWRTSTSRSELRSTNGDARRSLRLEAAGDSGAIVLTARTDADPDAAVERGGDGAAHTTHTVRGASGRSWSADGRRVLRWAETSRVVAELTAPAAIDVDALVRIAEQIEGDLA